MKGELNQEPFSFHFESRAHLISVARCSCLYTFHYIFADPSSSKLMTIEDCLLQSLTDKSHVVRMKAADYVRNLFLLENGCPVAPSHQQRVFDKVADALTELIVIKVSHALHATPRDTFIQGYIYR